MDGLTLLPLQRLLLVVRKEDQDPDQYRLACPGMNHRAGSITSAIL